MLTQRPSAAASPLPTRRITRRGGRCGRGAPVPLVVLEGRGGGAGPVVVTGQARGTTLQGVLAAPSVVVIARIIIKCVN